MKADEIKDLVKAHGGKVVKGLIADEVLLGGYLFFSRDDDQDLLEDDDVDEDSDENDDVADVEIEIEKTE